MLNPSFVRYRGVCSNVLKSYKNFMDPVALIATFRTIKVVSNPGDIVAKDDTKSFVTCRLFDTPNMLEMIGPNGHLHGNQSVNAW